MGIATVIYMRQNKYVRPVDLLIVYKANGTCIVIMCVVENVACNVSEARSFFCCFECGQNMQKSCQFSLPKRNARSWIHIEKKGA